MAWPILPLTCWLLCKLLYLHTALCSRWLQLNCIVQKRNAAKYIDLTENGCVYRV